MGKLNLALKDIGFLIIAAASYGFHVLLAFCNMRGPHPKDFCDFYASNEYLKAITSIHWIIAGIILVDIVFIIFSGRELIAVRTKKWISALLIASVVVSYILITLL